MMRACHSFAVIARAGFGACEERQADGCKSRGVLLRFSRYLEDSHGFAAVQEAGAAGALAAGEYNQAASQYAIRKAAVIFQLYSKNPEMSLRSCTGPIRLPKTFFFLTISF